MKRKGRDPHKNSPLGGCPNNRYETDVTRLLIGWNKGNHKKKKYQLFVGLHMNYSQSHSFDINLATKYSIEEAIIIHHFQHWIRVNKSQKINQFEERTWTYQTREQIASHFPYLSERQVKYITEKLVSKKVLITRKLDKSPFNHTLWYAFENEDEFVRIEENSNKSYERQNCQNGMTKLSNQIRQNCQIYICKDAKEDAKKEEIYIKKKYVQLTKKEYDDLCNTHGKELTDELIQQIDDHCVNNRPKGYRDYVGAFRTFLSRQKDRYSQFSKSATNVAQTSRQNIEKSKRFLKENEDLYRQNKINIGKDHFEINGPTNYYKAIAFTENGFMEQIECELRKCGIPFKKLT